MDATFHRRVERLLADRRPARLDHSILTATLAARQAAMARDYALNENKRAQAECGDEPLVELLLAGPDWQRAAKAQQGCFSRAEVKRRVNGP